MAELERSDHGETGEPATKRPRLESLRRRPGSRRPNCHRRCLSPVAPPLWLSGQLLPRQKFTNRDSGNGGGYGGVRGGRGRGGRGRGRSRGKNYQSCVAAKQKKVIFCYKASISAFIYLFFIYREGIDGRKNQKNFFAILCE
jgi:hypothetical protein